MNYSLLNVVYPSIVIFFIGFFVLLKYLRSWYFSFLISFIKSFIFFSYFYFFGIKYTFLDDINYFSTANKFLIEGKDFIYFIGLNINEIISQFGHFHFLYYLYNIFALEVFGTYYFAPVALNIILTYLAGICFYNLLLLLNFSRNLSRFFLIFYLIHWDILAWSSFINFKDFLVQFLTLCLIYNLIKLDLRFKVYNFVIIFILFILLTYLRFYIPYFLLLTYIFFKIYFKFKVSVKKINRLFIIIITNIILGIFLIIGNMFFKSEIDLFFSNFFNPLIGIIRFLFTPLPFHMKSGYEFLFFSSLLNFLMMPFFLIGVLKFTKINNIYKNFILLYFIIILFFYGSFIELQGPRHRIQILPFIILFQGLGLISFNNFLKKKGDSL